MNLKDALISSTQEILPMYQLRAEFVGEVLEKQMISAGQVNVMIGYTGPCKGNVVIIMQKSQAMRVVKAMMGGVEVQSLDPLAKSALGEMTNQIIGRALIKIQTEKKINITPPSLVVGEKLFLVISRTESTKLAFRVDNETIHISFSLEQ